MSPRKSALLDAAASALLVAFGSVLAATALYFVLQRHAYLLGPARSLVFVALPAALALAAFVAAPSSRRRPLAALALLLGICAYAGELSLSAANWRAWRGVLERSDPRPKIEVIEALRAAGQDAWPVVFPASIAGARRGDGTPAELHDVFPLGGIPEVDSVYCGEGRAFVVYRADRFGFFNPSSSYAQRPRVLLLGDSYVQGHCVGPDEGIAPRLRERFPGALNFGMNGNGPLAELATLREYGPLLRPEFVVWCFFAGNDLQNLESEKRVPALAAYLDPAHRQGLPERREEVDAALRAHVASERPSASHAALAETQGLRASLGHKLVPVLSLHNLLPFLGLPYGRLDFDYELLAEILATARDEVSDWGGELLFAYLPLTSDFYGLNRLASANGIARQRALAAAHAAGLRIVDLHAAIGALPDPMAVSSTPRTHYDALGYELVAGEIARALAQPDGPWDGP